MEQKGFCYQSTERIDKQNQKIPTPAVLLSLKKRGFGNSPRARERGSRKEGINEGWGEEATERSPGLSLTDWQPCRKLENEA